MQRKRNGWLAVLCGLAILLLLQIVTGQSRPQSQEAGEKEEQAEPQPIAPAPATPAEKAERDRVGEHFSPSNKGPYNRRPLDEPPQAGDPPLPPVISGYPRPLPALPFAQTSVAILGTVVRAPVYLTPNKMWLYTEYEIAVEEVFHAGPGFVVKKGDVVLAVRTGGSAEFPDGRVVRLEPSEIGRQLRTGGRYVLFLSYNGLVSRYNVMTAYELRADRVLATRTAGRWEDVVALAGKSEEDFLSAVRAAAR